MKLDNLVGPINGILEDWPDRPQTYRHNPADLRELLTMETVDELIDSGCIANRNVVLLRDGGVVEAFEYSSDGSMPRKGSIRAHLDQGGSISLRELHTLYPALAHLKDEIQGQTGCRTHVNAYLTPGNQQGLRYHYDPYVTLIVQLHGRKTWHLHPPMVASPTEEHDNYRLRGWTDEERRFLATTPPRDVVLEPGDVFWLPRGWVHSVETAGDVPSLHLTFALKERTQAWLIEHITGIIVEHAHADLDARQTIPPVDLLGDSTKVMRWARQYLIGAVMAVNSEATIESARTKARTT
ncbi:cupin [Streptomyces sp. A0642]|uniref:JmjC domain-containing protein n=1 Tax=Streptomyces sp. A0642 TaxID=2563100 RepID=UPI0010A21A29|nr:cupin domain-containing protein [Streptomyces sp. A0642]THA72481.1 cupin [Streptomyces sp. A0642]